ncbi:MAG: hypothetical protein ACFFCM_12435 [Promethearchaeota archaeon]
MDVNLKGRVRNIDERMLSKEPLMPVYEAVINSIQAIQESKQEDGKIIIKIIRETTTDGKKSMETPIKSFKILDNGIGFDDKNYKEFNTSDTDYKKEYGGKGIGRLTWLKAFDRVEIKSIFLKDGKNLERRFKFSLTEEISEYNLEESKKNVQTSVKLINFNEKYRAKVEAETEKIAQKILEHFLAFYIMGKHPTIKIIDEAKVDPIDIVNLYNEMKENVYEETIIIKEEYFKVFHLKLKKTHLKKNKIIYCAHYRQVVHDTINFSGRTVLTDPSGSSFYYCCYVISEYLDRNIDNSRQSFSIPDKDKEITNFFEETSISLETIKREVENSIKNQLKPIFEEIKEKKEEILESFTKINPQAIDTIKVFKNEIIEKIKITDPPKKVNDIYYKYKGKKDFESRQEINEVLSADRDEKDYEKKVKEASKKLREQEKNQLIEYMLYRHYFIELFKKKIELSEVKSISKEKVIHNIIFPMKQDSDSVDQDEVNLWILDEKLVFHSMAYSDKIFSKIMENTTSRESPDILVLCTETHGATVRSVSLFELKRPLSDSGDPIGQMYKYVDHIREYKKFKNTQLRVNDETIYYCYAVCDIDKKIKDLARTHQLTPLPFGIGYFTFNHNYNAFVEIRSYDEIYNDAVRRHRSFFDKLGLKYELD